MNFVNKAQYIYLTQKGLFVLNRMTITNRANRAWLNCSQLLNKCIFVLTYCTKNWHNNTVFTPMCLTFTQTEVFQERLTEDLLLAKCKKKKITFIYSIFPQGRSRFRKQLLQSWCILLSLHSNTTLASVCYLLSTHSNLAYYTLCSPVSLHGSTQL